MTNAASLPISPGLAEQSALDRAYSKITWRLIPFLAVLWILAWIDRVGVHDRARHAGDDRGLAFVAALVDRIEPVPAARGVGVLCLGRV